MLSAPDDAALLADLLDLAGCEDADATAGRLLRQSPLADLLAAPRRAAPDLAGHVERALTLVGQLLKAALRREIDARPLISSSAALRDYLHLTMAHAPREQLRLLLLDARNRLIDDRLAAEGASASVRLDVRDILGTAVAAGAHALIVAHNHPSGDPTPSPGDVESTRRLVEAGDLLGIMVHDHIVVGRSGSASVFDRL